MKYRYLYFALSLLIIVPGALSLYRYGLKLSIDFTGGSLLTLTNVTKPEEEVSPLLKDLPVISSTRVADRLSLDMKAISQADVDYLVASLSASPSAVVVENFETIGPVIGGETLKKTLYGLALASTLILLFVANAFKEVKFGVCAVIAMFHDSLVLLGSFSLLGHFFGIKVDLLFVTALLTILSFSVHDTIVVYDRIRELSHRESGLLLITLANRAATETIVRSLNNSLTIIFMLVALVLMGGESTRAFSLALLIGTVSGAYSSIFNAVPLLVVWDQIAKKINK